MNDVTRPGPYFDEALAELEDLYAQLSLSGATVVTTTFPHLAQIIPIGRMLGRSCGAGSEGKWGVT